MDLDLDRNGRTIVNALRHEPLTRGELADLTGWSRNTVATRLNELTEAGWVRENAEVQGERGRPSITYSVNPKALTVYVATFGWDQLHGAICGLDGEILAGEVIPFALGELADAVQAAGSQLERLRTHPGVGTSGVTAAVIAGPSPVANPVTLPAWAEIFAVPEAFAQRLGVPVTLENDANLMALGLRPEFPDAQSFVFVKIATGIGAGIIVNGRLHTGVSGLAGEIGHIPVRRGDGHACSCGNTGCLAVMAAVPGLLRQLSSDSRTVNDLKELESLVRSGDVEAVAALRAAGRDIGEALVGLVAGIAPPVLVLGGRLTQLGDHLTTGVRESLTQMTHPALSTRLQVTTTSTHRAAGLRGGAELAIDKLLEPG